MAALLVGAGVGSEDGLDDKISVDDVGTDDEISVEDDSGTDDEISAEDDIGIDDEVSADEGGTDIEVDVNWDVADVEPAWLADLSRDEGGGAIELLLLLLDAFALDPQQVKEYRGVVLNVAPTTPKDGLVVGCGAS